MALQFAGPNAGGRNSEILTPDPGVPAWPLRPRGGDILAPAFGMTVGAWIVAYISFMPLFPSHLPGQATVSLMLGVVFLGGFLTARYSRRGVVAALLAGLLSGALDILIVGAVLYDVAGTESLGPTVGLWMGGSVLLNGATAGLGGILGMMLPSPRRGEIRWAAVFALVLTAATLPLITAGGLVTAYGAGMSVPDWPLSYGNDMFLYRLSSMEALPGSFYEHTHRLMGTLVGLTSLTVAVYITIALRGVRLKITAWCIFGGVCVQGLLGGLRVTENSIPLATIHGIFAQVVLAAMACLAVACSGSYARSPRIAGASDRAFPGVLVVVLVLQLALGALVRQRVETLVLMHITLAGAVGLLALACGLRAMMLQGESAGLRPLRRTGMAVIAVVGLQLLLGIIALVLRPASPASPKTTHSALWTTAHQANGALLLALCAVLWLWNWRLFLAENSPRSPDSGATTQPDV